jgi:putative ABC transport system substrate-binding protein
LGRQSAVEKVQQPQDRMPADRFYARSKGPGRPQLARGELANLLCSDLGLGQRMQFAQLKRREFITLVGGSAAWPLGARAQQPAMPVIGFLHSLSPEVTGHVVEAFQRGLAKAGYVEPKNVAIEYRWARYRFDQLPAYAAELVGLRVTLIVAAGSTVSALAAKAATTTIPVVFTSADDPLKVGLVERLNRPGGNITGVTAFDTEIAAKRLQLLHQVLPNATRIALLRNPNSPVDAGEMNDLRSAAHSLGCQIDVVEASAENELELAFERIKATGAHAMTVSTDPFFFGMRNRVIEFAARHALPAIYDFREYPVAGGLMSYGTDIAALYHRVGIYAGKILAGAKPGDLPVVLPTKFELLLNLKTAGSLGLQFPAQLLALADEVIE